MAQLKLFMLLLGCKPHGRHTEQHDVFFGIVGTLNELLPEMNAFWPDAGVMHIDAWREVTVIDGFSVNIVPKTVTEIKKSENKLFFINLGGYLENRFEEQHYFVLTAKPDKAQAFKQAKETAFYKHNFFEGTHSHIDDRYGIDVDDLYEIDEVLSSTQKEKYRIELIPQAGSIEDELHIGYVKLSQLANNVKQGNG